MLAHFGSASACSSLAQWRYAFNRHSSSHSGSFFFADIVRTISSPRPGGTDSDSISLTKPYLYSRSARISTLFAALAMRLRLYQTLPLNRERSSAPAGALDVGILKHEARLHELFLEVELGAVQVQQAFHVDQNLGAILLENLVAGPRVVEVHLVLQTRAAAADNFEAQAVFVFLIFRGQELLDLHRGVFRNAHSNHGIPPRGLRHSFRAALALARFMTRRRIKRRELSQPRDLVGDPPDRIVDLLLGVE